MATATELKQLALHWSGVIKRIHPTIGVIVKGDPDSVSSLLAVWETGDPAFAKPTEAQLLTTLGDVLADIQSGQDAVVAKDTNKADVRTRFSASALATKTPQQIYTAMQGQIDGWTSLAEAKADLREWLPLMAAAIAHLVIED